MEKKATLSLAELEAEALEDDDFVDEEEEAGASTHPLLSSS